MTCCCSCSRELVCFSFHSVASRGYVWETGFKANEKIQLGLQSKPDDAVEASAVCWYKMLVRLTSTWFPLICVSSFNHRMFSYCCSIWTLSSLNCKHLFLFCLSWFIKLRHGSIWKFDFYPKIYKFVGVNNNSDCNTWAWFHCYEYFVSRKQTPKVIVSIYESVSYGELLLAKILFRISKMKWDKLKMDTIKAGAEIEMKLFYITKRA